MKDERFTELALEHLLSGLTGMDLITFRQELGRRGEAGRRELDRLRRSVAAVALTAPPVPPPAELRAQLLRDVGGAAAAAGDPPIRAGGAVGGGVAVSAPEGADDAESTPETGDAAEPIPEAGEDADSSPEADNTAESSPPVGDAAVSIPEAGGAEETAPGDAVKPGDPVMPRRPGHRHSRTSRRVASRGWLIAAAVATLLAAGFGALNLRLQSQLRQTREELESIGQQLALADGMQARVATLEGDLATVASPAATTVTLGGTPEQPAGRARVFIDPLTGRALIFVFDLEVLGPDFVYQLWAMRGATPVDAGVFTVDTNGRGRLETEEIDALLGADTLAVTVEPAPGQPSPTGAIVLSS